MGYIGVFLCMQMSTYLSALGMHAMALILLIWIFFSWYEAIPAKLSIIVSGNHDLVFNTNPEYARSLIPDEVVLLENNGIEYNGI